MHLRRHSDVIECEARIVEALLETSFRRNSVELELATTKWYVFRACK